MFIGLEEAYRDELRADLETALVDSATLKSRVDDGTSTATTNNQGGISASSGGRSSGFLEGDTFPCRIEHSHTVAGLSEKWVADTIMSTDQCLLIFAWDVDVRHLDRWDVTTRDNQTSTWEIREKPEQTDKLSQIYMVRRIQ